MHLTKNTLKVSDQITKKSVITQPVTLSRILLAS